MKPNNISITVRLPILSDGRTNSACRHECGHGGPRQTLAEKLSALKTNNVIPLPAVSPAVTGAEVLDRFCGQVPVANRHADTARKIAESVAYMRDHLDRSLGIDTLAAQAGLSRSHFFALFKRQTGWTPMDYFTHLRMEYACRLLEATSASVKEIAGMLGYDDPFYFSRVFKAVNHTSPSQFRVGKNRPLSEGKSATRGRLAGREVAQVRNGSGQPDELRVPESRSAGHRAAFVALLGDEKNQGSAILHSL